MFDNNHTDISDWKDRFLSILSESKYLGIKDLDDLIIPSLNGSQDDLGRLRSPDSTRSPVFVHLGDGETMAYEKTIQNWTVVGILMPIVIAMYLLLILMCYYIFRQKGDSWENPGSLQDPETGQHFVDPSPPPSYAIFVGNGDSEVMPPSYKMLFPHQLSSSVDSNNFANEFAGTLSWSTSDIKASEDKRVEVPSISSTVSYANHPTISILETSNHHQQQHRDHHHDHHEASLISNALLIDALTPTRNPSPRQKMIPRCGSDDEIASIMEDINDEREECSRSLIRRGSSF